MDVLAAQLGKAAAEKRAFGPAVMRQALARGGRALREAPKWTTSQGFYDTAKQRIGVLRGGGPGGGARNTYMHELGHHLGRQSSQHRNARLDRMEQLRSPFARFLPQIAERPNQRIRYRDAVSTLRQEQDANRQAVTFARAAGASRQDLARYLRDVRQGYRTYLEHLMPVVVAGHRRRTPLGPYRTALPRNARTRWRGGPSRVH